MEQEEAMSGKFDAAIQYFKADLAYFVHRRLEKADALCRAAKEVLPPLDQIFLDHDMKHTRGDELRKAIAEYEGEIA
jgi:hypothetical protein